MNEQRIAVITDTGTNTPKDFAAAHDVRMVPLRINYSDGSTFESGVDITPEQLVNRFDEEVPSTSLPSPLRIQETFEAARRDGYEGAVFVTISSGLSATYETVSMVARQMEVEGFPVVVVDTKSIGVAAGLVVMEAVRQVEAGMPLASLGSVLAAVSERTRVFFSVQNLDFLHKGGRIGDAEYRLGTVLRIKPVFTCNEAGRYVIAKKARGWKRALDEEVRLAVEAARGHERVRLAICSYEDEGIFERLEEQLRREVGAVSEVVEVLCSGISADLLVHTGPSLAGVAVMGC